MADSSVQDLLKMKVADLKKELKMRGLNTAGNKTELIDRLTAAVESDAGKIDNLSTEELIDDVLNDDEDLDEEIEDADVEDADKVLDIDTSMISVDESKPVKVTKRKSSETSEDSSFSKVPPKKIVLNRVLSVNTSQNKPESTTEKKTTENGKEPVQEDEKTDAVETPDEKRVIKLSNLSAKERLEMRAKKFGTPLTVDQKKEARSARFGNKVPISNVSATAKISVANSEPKIDALKKRAERFGTSVSPVMSKLDLQERLERRKARFGVVNTAVKKETTVK